jgi:hypothetical protein
MKAFAFWSILLAIVLGFVGLTLIGGCQPVHQASTKPPAVNPVFPHPGQTPPELKATAKATDVIIIVALLAVGIAVGLFFAVPATHNLSLPIGGAAAGVEAVALITRVSLWFIPWVALGLAVLGLGFFAYEVYRNRKAIQSKIDGAFASSTAVTKLVHG